MKGKHTAAHVAGIGFDVRASMSRGAHGAPSRAALGRGRVAVGAHGVAAVRPSVGKARWSIATAFVIAVIAMAIATGAGLGLASAGGSAIVEASNNAEPIPTTEVQADISSASVLAQAAQRDVSGGVAEIAAEEEEARIAAEKAAAEREAQCIAQAKAAQAKSAANGGVGVYAVDWSVGHDMFVAQWTARIDKYLAGSPLAGYGSVFAEAAWNNGVDPRWSPAISNTESTKARNCFASHNAWGWTNGAWGDWNTAINAHVKGLAEVYGYTISYNNACRYCPPNKDNWYRDTLNEMQKI